MKRIIIVALTVIGMFFLCGNVQADLSSGLVAYYPFNGNANDESGNGNNGTVNGATLTTDRFGNANSSYSFDGNADSVNLYSSINYGKSFTVFAWVNPQVPSVQGKIFYVNWRISLMTKPNNGGEFDFVIGDGSAWNNNGSDSASHPFQPGKWYNVTGTYDGNSYKLYVDGVLIDSVSSTMDVGSGIATIGTYDGSTTYTYTGKIDDVRIYNRALSDSEIQQLYTENNCPSTSGGYTQSDLNTQYQAGYAAGLAANGNSASITINSDLSFKIPNATYIGLFGSSMNLETNFKFFGDQNGKMLWELDSYTVK